MAVLATARKSRQLTAKLRCEMSCYVTNHQKCTTNLQ